MVPRHTRLHPAWYLAVLLVLALLAAPWSHAGEDPFVMGIDETGSPENAYTTIWLNRTFAEAFRRLGVPLKIARMPAARLTLMLEQGSVDGEMARAINYAAAHPSLVRVTEPSCTSVFALYTGNPAVRMKKIEDLASGEMTVEYRIGVAYCERALKAVVPAEKLSSISSARQGLQKLQAGRSDVYCDIDLAVANSLYSPEFRNATSLRKLIDISEEAPLYPYVLAKHAALAVKLAAVLKKMRAEGLVEQYRLEALREAKQ